MKKTKKTAALLLACILLSACANPMEATTEATASEQEEIIAEENQSSEPVSLEAQSTTIESTTEESIAEESVTDESTTEPTDTDEHPTESSVKEEHILTAKVPSDLQTLLKESFLDGTSAETLKPLVIDVVVETEEYDSYRGLGADDMLEYLDEWGGILLRVDADNDGIGDLFAWIRDGGSSGNTSFQLAKGKEDGTYEVTEYQGSMSQEIAFIEFEGQNYLLETDFEYNRKAVNGFIVTAYEQGRVSEQVYLEAVPTVWEPNITSCMSGYEALAEQYAELGKEGFHDDNLYDYRVDAGSAERVEKNDKTVYYADINNDGVEEWYEKHIFYPSSIGAYVSLENDLYFAEAPDKPEYLTFYYDLQYEGIPLTFWVEQTTDDAGQTKQVVCLLTYKGLSANWVYGYLIEGDNVTEVFEIEYEGQLEWRN